MKLTVTKGHFDKAIKYSTPIEAYRTAHLVQNCLIAQAFKSAFPSKRVEVTYTVAHVGGKQRLFNFPKSVSNLIERFDALAYVAAGTRTKAEETRLAKLRASLPRTFEIGEVS